jgi:hypothetical protein
MNKKSLTGALVASLSLPLMLATLSVPLANAASVSSSVETVDNCKWVMANIPEAIEMSAAVGAKFNGDALSVSDPLGGPTLGLSGDVTTVVIDAESSTACSFYNVVLNSSMSATLDDLDFVASYYDGETPILDDTMDFSLAVGVPLTFTPDAGVCAAPWAPLTINMTNTDAYEMISYADETGDYVAGDAPWCSPTGAISLEIPQRSSVPAGAGKSYVWAGPTLTFSSTPSNSYNYVTQSEPAP